MSAEPATTVAYGEPGEAAASFQRCRVSALPVADVVARRLRALRRHGARRSRTGARRSVRGDCNGESRAARGGDSNVIRAARSFAPLGYGYG